MSRYESIKLSKLRTYSIQARNSKVETALFAKKGKADTSAFLDCLPDILSAKDLKALILKLKAAKKQAGASLSVWVDM